jgi:hypothetical protein
MHFLAWSFELKSTLLCLLAKSTYDFSRREAITQQRVPFYER